MIPGVRLEIDGKPASSMLMLRLSSIVMTDEAGVKADTVEMTIDGREDLTPPPAGGEVKLWMGYEPTPVYRGRFKIMGWEFLGPPQSLVVTATAADFTTSLKTRRSASYHEMTVGHIVEDIANRHGLAALIGEGFTDRPIEHIDQQNESDAAFLSRLATRQGAMFKLGAGRLIFADRGSPLLATGELKQVFTIKPGDLSDYSFRHDGRAQFASASAEWFDKAAGKRKRARTGVEQPQHRDDRLYSSEAEALAAAGANLDQLNRGVRTAEFSAPGIPEIYADAIIRMTDFFHAADGDYSVIRAVHSISGRSGYTTSVELEGFNGK